MSLKEALSTVECVSPLDDWIIWVADFKDTSSLLVASIETMIVPCPVPGQVIELCYKPSRKGIYMIDFYLIEVLHLKVVCNLAMEIERRDFNWNIPELTCSRRENANNQPALMKFVKE